MKKGLGRGLDSLFGVYNSEENVEEKPSVEAEGEEKVSVKNGVTKISNYSTSTASTKKEVKAEVVAKEPTLDLAGKVVNISIGEIDPNKDQPRKTFHDEALNELADSIRVHGVIQPIILVKVGTRYMIIAGERRWRAARIAGLKEIPAIVKDYDSKEITEISIIENLQREDLNPMEQARAIKKLMDDFGLTQEEVATRLGKSRSVIANTVRLIGLEPEVVKMIEEGKISAGHARSLVVVTDRNAQLKLANQVSDKKLTVRDLEFAVKSAKKTSGSANTATPVKREVNTQSIELKQLVADMQRVFATKVSAMGTNQRGRLYIDYYNRDDLERIYQIVEFLKKSK